VTFCYVLCVIFIGPGSMEVFAFPGAPLSRRFYSAGIQCVLILVTWHCHIICWHTSQGNARRRCTMLEISLIPPLQLQTRSVAARRWSARTTRYWSSHMAAWCQWYIIRVTSALTLHVEVSASDCPAPSFSCFILVLNLFSIFCILLCHYVVLLLVFLPNSKFFCYIYTMLLQCICRYRWYAMVCVLLLLGTCEQNDMQTCDNWIFL